MSNEFSIRPVSTPTPDIKRPSIVANFVRKSYSSLKGKQRARDGLGLAEADETQNTTEQTTIRYGNIIINHNQGIQSRQLPNEIVSLILDHLNGHQKTLYECILVTKQFHVIARPLLCKAPLASNPYLWRVLDLCYSWLIESVLDNPRLLPTVGPHICVLRLHDNGPCYYRSKAWPYDGPFTNLIPHLTYLKSLTIGSGVFYYESTFQLVADYCHSLTSLHLDGVPMTESSFATIGRYCSQLSDLEWKLQTEQLPEWLACLTSCPLECLKIDSIGQRLNRKAAAAIKTFKHLTCLDITQVWGSEPEHFLLAAGNSSQLLYNDGDGDGNDDNTDTAFNPGFWPQLEKLALHPCLELDDVSFIEFIKRHPRLSELYLRVPRRLTNASMLAIPYWLPNLTRLSITKNDNITPTGVRQFVDRCSSKLTYVQISHCDKLSAHNFPETKIAHGPLIHLDWKAIETIRLRGP